MAAPTAAEPRQPPADGVGIYRPRRPRASPLYQLLEPHFRELCLVWDERFASSAGDWRAVIPKVVDQVRACGLLEHGFARIRCDACAHEYLLAQSQPDRAHPDPSTENEIRADPHERTLPAQRGSGSAARRTYLVQERLDFAEHLLARTMGHGPGPQRENRAPTPAPARSCARDTALPRSVPRCPPPPPSRRGAARARDERRAHSVPPPSPLPFAVLFPTPYSLLPTPYSLAVSIPRRHLSRCATALTRPPVPRPALPRWTRSSRKYQPDRRAR